jgi:antitoxin (DNA-binding transcriptional repressor) of toxin-antitoxin stability system
MERIGIRELRENLHRYLERAGRGEAFDVTDGGRPLARLGPLPEGGGRLARLIADGRMTPAKRRLSDLPEARPAPDGRSATHALLAERDADPR